MKNTEIAKYKKQINVNGWMYRLQRWTTGSNPRFSGYCPFFWFTWVCVLISPVVLIGKIFEYIGSFVNSKPKYTFNNINELRCIFTPDLNDLRVLYYYCEENNNHPKDLDGLAVELNNNVRNKSNLLHFQNAYYFSNDFVKWAQSTPNWKEYALKAIKIKEIELLKDKKNKERENKNQKIISNISNYSSYFVKPILACFALFIIYTIVYTLYSYATTINYKIFFDYVKTLFLSVGGFAMWVLLCYISFWIFEKMYYYFYNNMHNNMPYKNKKELYFDSIIKELDEKNLDKSGFFDKIDSLISQFGIFIIETIEMTYKKECPLIEYGEKSGKIEKRK